jgi:hypothetical protein
MIRFADSCSWATTSALNIGAGLKYTYPYPRYAFEVVTGRDQYAYYAANIQNIYGLTFDVQPHWRFSFSFNYSPIGARWESNIAAWLTSGACVSSVSVSNDGHLRIYAGGDGFTTLGTLAYVSQAVLTANTWYSVDFDWYFPASGNGWCAMYINDVLDTTNPGNPSANNIAWGVQPSLFQIVANVPFNPGNGFNICDIVVSDGTGSVNNTRLGPCRVKAYFPGANAFIDWPTVIPGSDSAWQAISENPASVGFGQAPDGNTSYITGGVSGHDALFSFPSVDCYAGILGIALNVCARDPSAQSLGLIVRPQPSNGMDVVIGTVDLTPSFAIKQAITEQNAGSTWVDGAIENAWWGVQAGVGGSVVTQLCLEKVTTRRALPYQCGQLGSYCY